jgi:hypothetical protein
MRIGLGLEDDGIEHKLVTLTRHRPCSPPPSREDIARIARAWDRPRKFPVPRAPSVSPLALVSTLR